MITKVIISDLHIGGLTDFWALENVIEQVITKLKRLKVGKVDLILLGDVHDYQSLYPTQVTLTRGVWQSYAAAGVIEWIIEKFKANSIEVEKIIIVEGNHDRRIAENMSLSEVLLHALNDMGYDGKAFVSSYYIDEQNEALYRHAILERTSGSYIYGITPRMIKEADKIMLRHRTRFVISGHVHKYGCVKTTHGYAITLPSFQIDLSRGENDRGALIMLDGNTPIPVDPTKAIEVVDVEDLMLEVLVKLVEFIKIYRKKSSIPYHRCAIKELLIGLPRAKKAANNGIWWKYAIIRIGSRTRVVDGDLMKRIVKIYEAFETTAEAIEHMVKVLGINVSTARNYIWSAIKLGLCKPKPKGKKKVQQKASD